jgi:hypothetical protein
MKKLIYVMVTLFLLSPVVSFAGGFLDAPLPLGGKVVSQTDKKMEADFALPYDQALAFYKSTLLGTDYQFRKRDNATYIEEYGARPWHSILITKVADGTTKITVTKDSWTWIVGTLTLRFFAVLLVLICLFIPLSILGLVMKRIDARKVALKSA